MALGPGKYDELCTEVRTKADAQGCILIIFGGNHGFGFSVQASPGTLARLPKLLRELADAVERDMPEDLRKVAAYIK